MKVYQIERQTFVAVCLVLIFGVLLPGVDQWQNDEGPILFSSRYREQAFVFQLKLFAVFLSAGGILLWLLGLGRSNRVTLTGHMGFNRRIPNAGLITSALTIGAILLWLIAHDFRDIVSPSARFSSEYPVVASIAQWLFLAAFMVCVSGQRLGLGKWIRAGLLLSLFLVYPISTSSRSVGIPFLFLAVYFSVRGRFSAAIFWCAVCSLFVSASLLARGDVSSSSFYSGLSAALDPLTTYELISSTFPGTGSTGLALEMFERKESFGMSGFFIYVSPLPSAVLQSETFSFSQSADNMLELNFTEYLSASNIDLNADIFSEWIFWGGDLGWLYGGLFFVALVITPLIMIRFGLATSLISRLTFQAVTLFFFIAGMSMQVRAASRLYVYALCLIMLLGFVKKMRHPSRLSNSP